MSASAQAGGGLTSAQYQSMYQLENPVRAQPLGYQSVADPAIARSAGGISYGVGDASTTWAGRYLKVFIPAGSKLCTLGGYLPQGVPYTAIVRAGTVPSGFGVPLPSADSELGSQLLMSGTEYQTSHNGGGFISMISLRQGYLSGGQSVNKGAWVYIDIAADSYQHIHALQYICEISDWAKYEAEFYALRFDRNGDPLEDQSGSGVTTVPGASAGTALNFKEFTTSLKFDITHSSGEVSANAAATYFLAAVVPRSAVFPHDTAFFYLVPSPSGGFSWASDMVDGNPYSLAMVVKSEMKSNTSFDLSLGLTREIVEQYGVQFYFAYKLSTQSFKDMGKIFPR